jgi:hypothetical protein
MINNILKKIEKANEVQNVELEKHEVELGVLQDIEKEMSIANQGVFKSIDLAKSALKPAQESLRLNKELLVKLQNFTKQVKDLGILSPQKEVENGILKTKENIKMIETLIKNLHIV